MMIVAPNSLVCSWGTRGRRRKRWEIEKRQAKKGNKIYREVEKSNRIRGRKGDHTASLPYSSSVKAAPTPCIDNNHFHQLLNYAPEAEKWFKIGLRILYEIDCLYP